jgi:hypothetical protein
MNFLQLSSFRSMLQSEIEDKILLRELLIRLQAVEDAKSPKGWAAAYSKFVEGLANHVTIIAPLLPAIAETVNHLNG